MYLILYMVPLIVLSGCSIIWPEKMWYLYEGWKFKNVQPSAAALIYFRISGVMGFIGVIVMWWLLRQ